MKTRQSSISKQLNLSPQSPQSPRWSSHIRSRPSQSTPNHRASGDRTNRCPCRAHRHVSVHLEFSATGKVMIFDFTMPKTVGTLSELLTDAAADVFSLLFGAEAYQSVSLLFAG